MEKHIDVDRWTFTAYIYLLIFCLLATVLQSSGEQKTSSGCFKSNFVTLKLVCDVGSVIQIKDVAGGTQTDNCTQITELNCTRINWKTYVTCNGKTQCQQEFVIYHFQGCNVTAAQVKYDCIEDSNTFDICANEYQNTDSMLHLKSPVFPKSNASYSKCTCLLTASSDLMAFQILSLDFSYEDNYTQAADFTVVNSTTVLWDTERDVVEPCPTENCLLQKKNLIIAQSQKKVQIFYNNKNQSQQNVWLEIKANNSKITVECNGNISDMNILTISTATVSHLNSTSLSTGASPPSTFASTVTSTRNENLKDLESIENKRTTVIIIVISTILGILLVGAAITGVFVIRRRFKRKEYLEKKTTDMEYDNKCFQMDETYDNSNRNKLELHDYTEINLDNQDGKPKMVADASHVVTTPISKSHLKDDPWESNYQQINSNGYSYANPCVKSSEGSRKSERQFDKSNSSSKIDQGKPPINNDYAIVVPNKQRKVTEAANTKENKPDLYYRMIGFISDKNTNEHSLNRTAGNDGNSRKNTNKEQSPDTILAESGKNKPVGNSIQQPVESRDSVPYMLPLDSLKNSKRKKQDSEDEHPYSVPADAIGRPASEPPLICLPGALVKDKDVYESTLPKSKHAKLVAEEDGQDSCKPGYFMEDNELYYM